MRELNYKKELELKNKEVDKELLSMFFKLEMLLKADQNQNKDYINV